MIETTADLTRFQLENHQGDWIVHAIPEFSDRHPAAYPWPCILFIRNTLTGKTYYYSFSHPDSGPKIDDLVFCEILRSMPNRKWALDKKMFDQLISTSNVCDANLLSWMQKNEIFEVSEYETTAHYLIRKNANGNARLNLVIPLLKHKEAFEDLADDLTNLIEGYEPDLAFVRFNDLIIGTLGKLEKHGIFVDRDLFLRNFGKHHEEDIDKNNLIYTQYHPYHLSGRPSNTFGGINYSALKKKDGTRSFIKSRYKDGKLVLIDYKSYHPHLLSSLIDYKFQIDDAYSFLASQYFNKSLVQIDEYDINQSKKITFEMLYGKIKPQYLHIKFLGQVQDLIEELWRKFNACGFVETPVFKRKIYKSWVKDMTPNKLMNYILQSYETERNMGIIKLMMDRIRDRKTKIILYQYDSVLLDFHKDDVCIMDDIKNIMDYKNYPISISVGNEFNNMMEMPMQH